MAKYLKRNPASCFVAEDDGKIIGVILAGHDGRRGYIYHTAVMSSHRGQGIAKRLVDNAMDVLDKEGIHKVALVAFNQNKVGNEFWENMGFTVRDDLIYRNKNIHELQRIDS
ncbi:MAG: GNAT family N-acetyltransferase [Clostridium sp.]|nr:GNAT family N-acetyltransferase [Clostridium sp.]MCM1209401.1 GNAT family N-acetyltransferase [Ruminococcus sp.]